MNAPAEHLQADDDLPDAVLDRVVGLILAVDTGEADGPGSSPSPSMGTAPATGEVRRGPR